MSTSISSTTSSTAYTPPADGTSNTTMAQAKVIEGENGRVHIAAGKGSDEIDLSLGEDGLVHVTVNGEEVYSCTPEEAENLVIHGGRGDDQIKNSVDGVRIRGGRGDDRIFSEASNVTIFGGRGDDRVRLRGDANNVRTGRGDDVVNGRGQENNVFMGRGDDLAIGLGRESNDVRGGLGRDHQATRKLIP